MTAYIDLNGFPASGIRRLSTEVPRETWVDGFVVSDASAVANRTAAGRGCAAAALHLSTGTRAPAGRGTAGAGRRPSGGDQGPEAAGPWRSHLLKR
jgi:hypothetical protein